MTTHAVIVTLRLLPLCAPVRWLRERCRVAFHMFDRSGEARAQGQDVERALQENRAFYDRDERGGAVLGNQGGCEQLETSPL